MERMRMFLIGGLCALALPATVRGEPSRDQAILNAILRVETRYLDDDRRNPNIAFGHTGQASTVRKAKYLDKLLDLEVLDRDTVLTAFESAQERVKSAGGLA